MYVKAGAYSKYVGRLDLDVKNGYIRDFKGELIRLDANVQEDPNVTSIIHKYNNKMSPYFGEVVGSSEIDLDGSLASVRSFSPSPLGTFVAYVMAHAVGVDAGLINGGHKGRSESRVHNQ